MKILVVDDHLKMRLTISHMLKTAGYDDVVGAGDGDEALRKIETGGIDMVICDWNMPRMKGVEVLQAIREKDDFKEMPFLMVTAEVNEHTVMQALETDVDGYIIKPFKASTLIGKLESILDRRKNPTTIDVLIKSGSRKLESGDVEGALVDFERALNEDEDSPRVHFFMGEALAAKGENTEAVNRLKRALELAPNYVKAYDSMAELLKKNGNEGEALNLLAQAVSKSPLNPDRQVAYGSALLEAGELEKAHDVFRAARKHFPANAELETRIGEAYLRAGLNQEAETAFEASTNLNPEVSHVYNQLGIAYRKQGKYKAAIDNYRKALRVSPDDANLYYNMGVAHLEAREADASIRALSQAVELNPGFSEAAQLLDRIKSCMADGARPAYSAMSG